MAVRDGIVAWLGTDDVGRGQFPDAEIVDLDGAFVAPAFVDSHVHLTATGLTLTGLDLRQATSAQHCLQLIAEYARAHPDGPIWGHGWDESGWPSPCRRPPTISTAWSVTDPPTWPESTSIRRRRPRRCAGWRPELRSAQGFDPQRPLTADAHHLVRAAARDRLTADATGPRQDRGTGRWRPPTESSRSTNAQAPTSAAWTTGRSCAASSTASRSSATGVRP